MQTYPKGLILDKIRPQISFLCLVILLGSVLIFSLNALRNEAIANSTGKESANPLSLIQENSLLPVADPNGSDSGYKVTRRMNVIATAYSSTVEETDDTPFLTAAGTQTRNGIIANNILPFGTKVRIPELYGDKVFVVEDRMNWKKGNYQIDIWFPSHGEATEFGAKNTYIEVLEN